MRSVLVAIIALLPSLLLAKAEYSLSCNAGEGEAKVYVCNSGNSAEGNNRYVTVRACGERGCREDYDLYYIYATPGDCDHVGTMDVGAGYDDYCIARFRE